MIRILHGDCREVLKTLPEQSVQCCVTSPPYFGLRDYGTAKWDGGDPACDHLQAGTRAGAASTLRNDGREHVGPYESERNLTVGFPFKHECGKCGARRVDSQIGLEATPSEYVAEMVAVFREVRRVLRDDGTLWLNLGDSYAGSWGAQSRGGPPSEASTLQGNGHIGGGPKLGGLSAVQIAAHPKGTRTGSIPNGLGLKPKDLIGIPWRTAFALQADGWWLRQDIIWSKPNPMPESVTDRCTKAHEYVFMLSKSARYYFDAEAIYEDATTCLPVVDKSARSRNRLEATARDDGKDEYGSIGYTAAGKRNKRSVWTIATQPYSEAHFATMAPALAETCIKAGCPEGGTVLDPFGGAGTRGLVADRLQRDALLIELSPDYIDIAKRRISGDAPLFAEVAA